MNNFLRHKEVSFVVRGTFASQLSIETIVASVCKSDHSFDLQTDIIFGGNGGVKINKFLDYIESIGTDRNLRSNTPHIPYWR